MKLKVLLYSRSFWLAALWSFTSVQIMHDDNVLDQGSPNYGPGATCGPRSHFIRPAKLFCQWWKNKLRNVFTENLLIW